MRSIVRSLQPPLPIRLAQLAVLALPSSLLLGILLRLGRLTWQPLWADEGYSVYFATESVTRLLWLTANDIHPPLYYLLLHGWLALWETPSPLALRLFSVLLALPVLFLTVALAQSLFVGRRQSRLLLLALLVLNPLYLYYSQEVRMYGLALTLSLATTLCCWRWVLAVNQGKGTLLWLAAYVVAATAALYTLYYLAFLLLAQFVWVVWTLHKARLYLLRFVLADLLVGLLYLPWVIYTAQILLRYVDDKVRSDQDVALAPWQYLTRHLLAFTGGHLPFPAPLTLLPWLALISAVGLLGWSLWRWRDKAIQPQMTMAQRLLWLCFVVPFAAAFLVNQFYPFFPTGGERLLLFVLPYFLLLLSSALDDLGQQQSGWQTVRIATFALLVTTAAVGAWVFYTLPRYQADDYRPLIRQIVQQGRDNDTVIATFPWQVGFWRAYAPQAGLTTDAGPQMQLLSDRSVIWDATVAQRLDEALARGMLWLPSLRSIGSTLPDEMTNYLANRAVNFAQQWVSATTQLDAWHHREAVTIAFFGQNWGDLQLSRAGVSATTVSSANTPLIVELGWRQVTATLPPVGVTLRLQKDGSTWAYRDYAAVGAFTIAQKEDLVVEQVGLLIPPGLPPGDYQLMVGLVDATGTLRKPTNGVDPNATLLPLTTITLTAPAAAVPPYRLPIQFPLAEPVLTEGVALLGHSGGDTMVLAGTDLALTFFWQKQAAASPDRHLYVSLLDRHGAGVAGWEGWPLPAYPLSQWPDNALVQTPIAFTIPATVGSGAYELVAGLLDPATGVKRPPIALGNVQIYQRQANFIATLPPTPLPQPAQFGVHVQLLGYDRQQQGDQLLLTLYWQVLQPLLPPHHIFVHLNGATGITLAQSDAAPQTATESAPTGSWQPGEFLTTRHTLTIPSGADATALLRVGLYVPQSGVRLPLTINGAPSGDALTLPFTQ